MSYMAVAFCTVILFFYISERNSDLTGSEYRSVKIKNFWTWFDANKNSFADSQKDKDEHLTHILAMVSRITTGLSIELSANTAVKELVVSAEGGINNFSIVEEIVAAAPIMAGWKVVAFRQPIGGYFTLKYEDISLTPSKLYFAPIVDGDSLDIIVFGEGFDNYERGKLAHYGLIMIDNLIGEYNCVTKVRHYDFQELQETKKLKLKPLLKINSFIEDFYKSMSVKNNKPN